VRHFVALGLILAAGIAVVTSLTRASAPPRPRVWRLVDRLTEARRVEQKPEQIEPEVLHLKPGMITPPEGWTSLPGEAVHFVAPSPRPIRVRVDVPITNEGGGRDYVVKVMARDAAGNLRMLVQHAPNLEQPDPGWHKATEERAGGRAHFDWREDTPPEEKALPVVLESPATPELIIESFSVHEAGARDPSIIEAAPGVALHGLVDRPVEGVKAHSRRGARRLLPSLLSSDGGFYEWALPRPAPAELRFQTAMVPRGPATAASEMRIEVETAGGWTRLWSEPAGESWREVKLAIPPEARALRLSTVGPGVAAWGNPTLRDPPVGKQHVLLITLDAVRPDHLGMYGGKRPTSPFLDGLAARGLRFTDVTAQRGHTWASTTSLLTGQFPQTNGVIARGERPHRGAPGLGPAFAEAGYTTVRIGAPDLPRGQLTGFDDVEIADYDTDAMARLAEVGRASYNDDGPLFVWVHISTAHYPWQVADEFNRFDPGYQGPYKSGISRAQFRALVDAGPDERLKQHLTALYDGAILQMDQRLGKTLASLDDVHFFDDAIVAVTADHGAHFGEKDVWFMHSTPWKASLQVPLFITAPGRLSPGISDARALLVDVAPTLLDLAGLPPDDFDGVSLREGKTPERTTVTRFDPASYVVVENGRWKLLWNPKREPLTWPGEVKRSLPLPEMLLFDRNQDPDEKNDLSAAHPEVVAELRAAAERDQKEHAAGTHLSTEARRLLQQAGYLDDH
jgi:arylsulfatase A-like enzyme